MKARFISIVAAALAAMPIFAACSSDKTDFSNSGSETTGTVGLELSAGAGVTLLSVSYAITGPGGFTKAGTIDVSHSATVSAQIGGLPFGSGYTVTLTATSSEGTGSCSGSATFDITSSAPTPVAVVLSCNVQPTTGSVLVNGTLNTCPSIDALDVVPDEVLVGSSVALNASASDADQAPQPLTYAWSADSGTVTNGTAAAATFTCTKAGTSTVTLAVSDGDQACATSQSVQVTCSEPKTSTPIKHVIVLIGENRTFDHVFGTYAPAAGQTVSNLVSKGIVNADGTPGPNFTLAAQQSVSAQFTYYVGAPAGSKTPYTTLPAPTTNGAPTAQRSTAAPFQTTDQVAASTNDLAPADFGVLTTGATGLPARVVDTRVTNANNLPDGPFQMTGPTMPYDAYTGDTTHRFYQMWQQSDCSAANATPSNPSGCLGDLFPFVITTFSTSNNGVGNSMAFFNVNNGDVPYLKSLADAYAMSDNMHQSVQGGTGANHSLIGFGDAVSWTDGHGNPVVPPTSQIANPNPKASTNNNYTVDGNASNCSDPTAGGVGPIRDYLASLPNHPAPNCADNTYYYLNNTNPGYLPTGALATGTVIPPTTQRSIADTLMENSITWKFYGGAYNRALAGKSGYCQICNPFEYQTQVMADDSVRTAHLADTVDMLTDITNGTLPAVSYAHPDGLTDGHPQSSKLGVFEAYVHNILSTLDANPEMKASTVVFVTFDEGGGYYDSGYIQPLDFFGDGPRIPLIVVSPYSTGGKVGHGYADHVSILKFIERNWSLSTITSRSRDNLPNPVTADGNPYVPTNSPALDDLFDLFDFSQSGH